VSLEVLAIPPEEEDVQIDDALAGVQEPRKKSEVQEESLV
jgi:hypothetical protein